MWKQAIQYPALSDEQWQDVLDDAMKTKEQMLRFRMLLDCQLRSKVLLMSDSLAFKLADDEEDDG